MRRLRSLLAGFAVRDFSGFGAIEIDGAACFGAAGACTGLAGAPGKPAKGSILLDPSTKLLVAAYRLEKKDERNNQKSKGKLLVEKLRYNK